MKVALGFNIFLEHILPYEKMEEKGRMKVPPRVQLGGGAWNIAKSLESLGVPTRKLSLACFSSKKEGADRAAIEFLLRRELSQIISLPVKERPPVSYYLLPRRGKTWAFGDLGGKIFDLSQSTKEGLIRQAKHADIKIVAEVASRPTEISVAKLFFKKYFSHQKSILIPSPELIRSGKIRVLIPFLDCLVLNEKEGRLLFRQTPNKKNLFSLPLPYVLLTRGPKEAWLKVGKTLYAVKPRPIKNPPYIGGAGDATAAALIFSLFYKKEQPKKALKFAVEIGRRTLLLPTSHYTR